MNLNNQWRLAMGTTDILKDIEDMNSILDNPTDMKEMVEDPKEAKEAQGEAKEIVEETPLEPKDEKVVPEAKTEEKKEEFKVEVKEEVKPDERDKTIDDLRRELAALKAEKVVEKAPEKHPEEHKVEELKIEDQDFIGDLDLDEVTRDSKELNKLLNSTYRKARTDAEKAIITKLPELISSHVELVTTLRKASEDFYTANEDLKSFPKVVKVVFDELVQQNPNCTYGDVMKDVATETRKRLGLSEPKAKEVKKEEDKKEETKPPKLPSKDGGAGKPAKESKLDDVQSQIEEMNKAL